MILDQSCDQNRETNKLTAGHRSTYYTKCAHYGYVPNVGIDLHT